MKTKNRKTSTIKTAKNNSAKTEKILNPIETDKSQNRNRIILQINQTKNESKRERTSIGTEDSKGATIFRVLYATISASSLVYRF